MVESACPAWSWDDYHAAFATVFNRRGCRCAECRAADPAGAGVADEVEREIGPAPPARVYAAAEFPPARPWRTP